jgi:hypothetical protein
MLFVDKGWQSGEYTEGRLTVFGFWRLGALEKRG